MQTYKSRIWVFVFAVVIAVAGFASPEYASSGQTPEPELKTDPLSGHRYSSWARSVLATGDGVQLKLTKFEKKYAGVDYSFITDECSSGHSPIPDRVSDSDTASFCYGSFHPPAGVFQVDTGFSFNYDILIPNGSGEWSPSGYYVEAAAKVPLFGDPKIDCTIKQSGSIVPASGAPFRCDTSLTAKGNDSEPRWTITAKPVTVIDAANSANVARAAQLIGDNCTVFDTPRCSWTRTQKSSAILQDQDDWQSLTNYADSCPPTDPNRLFVLSSNRNVQISWSDKVGGKISAKLAGDAFIFKVEGTIEANYEHSITQTDSYGEGYQYTIPYNYRSALYLQHGILQVTGDFSIIADNGDRFLISNAVFRFPIQKDVQVEGKGQSVPRGVVQHVDIPCSQKAPSLGAPPPKGAKIGLATAKSPRP